MTRSRHATYLPALTLCVALTACEASFTDQRLAEPTADMGAVDQRVSDQRAADLALPADQRLTDADGAPTPDVAVPDSGPVAGVFASGPFAGRAGYSGKGTAELYIDAKGAKQLRFSSNFSTSSVPGPVVLLSSRAAIGTSINKSTDIHLGKLKSTSGAQVYSLPAGDGGRRYAWVYCEPFGVEVARAELKDKK